jgi:hypothetical protein
MSCFSGVWKNEGGRFQAQDISDETFVLDLEYAPEWSEEGDIIALAYQSNVEYFHFARFVGGQCVRELEYSVDHGWAKAEGEPEPWEANVLAQALGRADAYEPAARALLEEVARSNHLVAGKSVPLINAQDTVLDLMKLYALPDHVENGAEA